VRVGFSHPMLLREQLAALGMTAGHVRILVPMVNDVSELRAVRALMAGAAHPHSLGIMIETPASALLADALAAEADFFSIGSNDLTQYVLAIDRLNTELGHAFDGLHPAVLSAMRQTVAAARAHGKPVSICGGLAGDPEAIPILIGLGLRDLSVAPAQVAQVKAAVRGLDPILCAQLADAAVRLVDAPAVRTLVRSFLNPNNR
jgi:phosphoenolpyruvate-protein kinase (PTS system EI component)